MHGRHRQTVVARRRVLDFEPIIFLITMMQQPMSNERIGLRSLSQRRKAADDEERADVTRPRDAEFLLNENKNKQTIKK